MEQSLNGNWHVLKMRAKRALQSYTFLKTLHSTRVFWLLHSTKQGFSTVYRFPVRVSTVYWPIPSTVLQLKSLGSTVYRFPKMLHYGLQK